ncbi:hypothetical protein M427DRAFT_32178 [Gonapodya prolifera JEL478]|uniref:SH3 domain-containing protein n=1 Tax=Gonapodya prolifera (strain JEL478) TaxID=1344416 RepID=A0A139AH75_GONPJ|nr:hypothetical protein M427DRAFT_32178 [Gonapodya prolifera JEL478]|eukprot:KXS15763.1 hypothetical protein M427DRAFT_32178 [Gonapodya prolifera JEL478]
MRGHSTTTRVPSNADFISIVESGVAADVRNALRTGASATARKRVTITCRVTGRQKIWGGYSVENKTDTMECESALVLAIVHGLVEIVEVLLQNGVSPRGMVSWNIGNGWMKKEPHETTWTQEEWASRRWYSTYSFPSPLCLALGQGGKSVLEWEGVYEPRPDAQGRISINRMGGHVLIDNPRSDVDVRVWHRLNPRIEIVRLLLASGARVGDAEVEAARACPDPAFRRLVEGSFAESRRSRASTSSLMGMDISRNLQTSQYAPHSSVVDATKVITDQAKMIERLTARALTAERAVTAAEFKLTEHETSLAEERARNAELAATNSTFTTKVLDLDRETTSLKTEISRIQQQLASTTEENIALKRETATLRAQITKRATRATRIVNKVMFALADFHPREQDEIGLAAGDAVFVALAFADGWASGLNAVTHRFGFFPFCHVSDVPPALSLTNTSASQVDAMSIASAATVSTIAPLASSRWESLTETSSMIDSERPSFGTSVHAVTGSGVTTPQNVPVEFWRQFFATISNAPQSSAG